jgi:DNA modification methylase
MEYNKFLQQKQVIKKPSGLNVPREQLNPMLFDFQADIVHWCLQRGKSAIFADCGLGKTLMQLDWAHQIHRKENKPILILAPLAVSQQTVKEGIKFNIPVNICEFQKDVVNGINITNYEKLNHFDPDEFIAVVLDESSILKSYSGKTKKQIIESFKKTRYKLACTATPSPNDHMELLNQAAFLNVMESHQALAIWFINDTSCAGNYTLKGHATNSFWEWVSSWSVNLSSPMDLGYKVEGFDLPALNIIEEIVSVDLTKDRGDELIRIPNLNATAFHKEKRITAKNRAIRCAEIIKKSNDQHMIWCDTNYEADELKKAIPEAIEVRGSDSNNKKENCALKFKTGEIKILISKSSIFGFGLNFQNCHSVIFCGLSYSYESFYQATRRFWRYGQTKAVNCYIVLGETEINILNTIRAKENKYNELKQGVLNNILKTQNLKSVMEYKMEYNQNIKENDYYKLILGDSIEEIKKIPDRHVGLQIFSPPFSNLYIYSDSYRDMGNTFDDKHFFNHFDYLIPELYRILKYGRMCVVHCKDLVNYKNRDKFSGLRDFSGELIKCFEKHGFIYHSRVTIWKCPVTEMTRTKSHGLLYKQLRKDSTYSRVGIPDYLLIFRKWSDDYLDEDPVTHTKEDFELWKWQQYASPVWALSAGNTVSFYDEDNNPQFRDTGNFHALVADIKQTKVLNVKAAREEKDEKHICPLQLDVIERAVELWSNQNDIIFTPFMGIGSECYQSLLMGRRAIGIELKESYFKQAVANCDEAVEKINEELLFKL